MRVLPIAATALVAAAIVSGFWLRLEHIAEFVAARGSGASGQAEHERLFGRLASLGLLDFQTDGRINLPAADAALALEAAAHFNGGPADADWREKRDALASLHTTANGAFVMRTVGLWNVTRNVVAVRDNRPARSDPELGSNDAVLSGRPNGWALVDSSPRSGAGLSPSLLEIPHRYARFADPPHPGMTDWAAFGTDGDIWVTARTELVIEHRVDLTIQVVGVPLADTLPEGAVVTPLCLARNCAAGAEDGAEIRLPGMAAGRHLLTLQLLPVPNRGVAVADLRLHPGSDGRPVWREPRHGVPMAATAGVRTTDGVDLVSAKTGQIDPAADRLGLLPVTGYGVSDARGLGGILSRRQFDGERAIDVDLTIDSHVQEAAGAALATEMAAHATDDRDEAARRATVVVLDADSGAILGSARWPAPPGAIHAWDYAAIATGNPVRDPLTPFGWQGQDGDTPPGSTFKIVTAYAALGRAGHDPAVAGMVEGCAPLADGTLPCLGLNRQIASYRMPGQSTAVPNFHRKPLGNSLGPGNPRRQPACAAGPEDGTTRKFGLAEAIRDSTNVYFLRLAEWLDGAEALRYDGLVRRRRPEAAWPETPSSALVEAAEELGLFEEIDLAGGARGLIGPRSQTAGIRDILHTEPAHLDYRDLVRRQGDTWQRIGAPDALAMASIGQRAQVSPLHLARIAAAIATGALPSPHLIGGWDGQPVAPPPARVLRTGYLAPLRDGMKMVPETGTAEGAFRHWQRDGREAARCLVYGKTGTGEAGSSNQGTNRNTAWFVGWAEPEAFDILAGKASSGNALSNGRPAWRGRIAFACMATHNRGADRTGGAVCAPVIARLIERLAGVDLPRTMVASR